MKANSLLFRELLLLEFELCRQVEQAEFLFFFGDHFIKKRKMIAEEEDRRRIVYPGVFTDVVLKEKSPPSALRIHD